MRDVPPVTDPVTRATNGDKPAWDALVDQYAPLIWAICQRHHLNRAAASHVAQIVWLQAVDQLVAVHDPAALAGWLATTTQRECRRVLRAAPSGRAGSPCLADSAVCQRWALACAAHDTTELAILCRPGHAGLTIAR